VPDRFRQPRENLDAMVRIAELDLPQVLRAEGVLLRGLGGVEGDAGPLIGQREGGLPDHKVLPRPDAEPRALFAAKEHRVDRDRQLHHPQFVPAVLQPHVLSRDMLIPGNRPETGRAPHDDRFAFGQAPPPALLRFGPLGNQIGHELRSH
jgi:hypothetical protein